MTLDRRTRCWNGWGWPDHPDGLSGREEVWNWMAGELRMPALLLTPALPLRDTKLPPARLTEQDRRVLSRIVGADQTRVDLHERALHAGRRSYLDMLRRRAGDLSAAPDAVVYPVSTEQVLMLLAYAAERNIAVIPYGGGSSMVAGSTPTRDGHAAVLAVNMLNMAAVESVDVQSQIARAQAGIVGPALEEVLGAQGLTLGHFPPSFEFSTIGGWIGEGGAGQYSNGYGRPEDWLIAAELATPSGVLRVAAAAGAASPPLTELVTGSAGVFGIVTHAAMRVHPAPESVSRRAWIFQDFAEGVESIREAVQTGIPAAMLRLSDPDETRFLRALSQSGREQSLAERALGLVLRPGRYSELCTLVAVFEGTRELVRWSSAGLGRIARRHGGSALGRAPAEQWYRTRFQAPYWRDAMLDRGLGVETFDTATSWSNLPRLYAGVKLALETSIGQTVPRAGARGLILCHTGQSSGNGANLEFTCIFPRALDSEIVQCKAIQHSAWQAIAGHGGTLGHHQETSEAPAPRITQEKGALGLETLRAVKHALDPKGILNPGKLIP